MSARLLLAAVLTCSASAFAQNAQDELERQLKEMVGRPPTKLLLEYEGLDQPNYKLVEISFDLDGSTLPASTLEKLNAEGKHLIFHGDVKPGKHTIEATVVLTDIAGALFSYEAGYKWTLKLPITFEQQAGLEVHIVVIPELSLGEKDAKKKFKLRSTAAVKMLAKVEDGTMPESPRPNIAVAPKDEPPDAGAPLVAELSRAEQAKILKAEQAEAARLKKQQAMEEAQRKKDEKAAAKAAAIEAARQKSLETAEARKAAAEERKRKAQDSADAKRAAAEEKKRKAQEVAEARKAAEEEKKRQKAEALAAAKEPKQRAGPSQPGEPTQVAAADPGGKAALLPTEGAQVPAEPSQATVDAGPTLAAAEPPKQPAKPTPAGAESEGGGGLPWPILIGAGVAVLGLVVFLATRKKDTPPY